MIESSALRHQVAHRVLVGILTRRLEAGEKLVVQKLARELNVSATPVREALLDLESQGFVRFEHRRGAVVAPFGPRELLEIYSIRGILESQAARLAAESVDRGRIEQIRDEIRSLLNGPAEVDRPSWVRRELASDRALHAAVSRTCGNARLAREIKRYEVLVHAVRDVLDDQYDAQAQAMAEHLRIIGALLAHDAQRAETAMAEHIHSAARYAVKLMFQHDAASEADDRSRELAAQTSS